MSSSKSYRVPINNHDYRKIVGGLECSELTLSEKTVLLILAHHTDANGYCFPSQKRIAKLARVSVRTVQRALKRLEKLKLIRIVSRTKTGFRNGSCGYAITVSAGTATRHHVDATLQIVVSERDKVTELNRVREQTRDQLSDLIRLVGDKFLSVLEPIIDFSQSPWMISTAQICKRLFNACPPSEFEGKLKATIHEAEQLRKQYERADKKLTNWMPLIERMHLDSEEPTPPKRSTVLDAEEPLAPLIEELKSFLRTNLRNDPKITLELLRLVAFEAPDAIELTSASRMTIDKVHDLTRPALRLLASSYNKSVVLKHDGTIIYRVKT